MMNANTCSFILLKLDLFRNARDPFSALLNGLRLLNKTREH